MDYFYTINDFDRIHKTIKKKIANYSFIQDNHLLYFHLFFEKFILLYSVFKNYISLHGFVLLYMCMWEFTSHGAPAEARG